MDVNYAELPSGYEPCKRPQYSDSQAFLVVAHCTNQHSHIVSDSPIAPCILICLPLRTLGTLTRVLVEVVMNIRGGVCAWLSFALDAGGKVR